LFICLFVFADSVSSGTIANASTVHQIAMSYIENPKMGPAGHVDYGFNSFPQREIEMPPTWLLAVAGLFLLGAMGFWCYLAIHLLAPRPRPPRRSEKQYLTILPDGTRSTPLPLPCWLDTWAAAKAAARKAAMRPGAVKRNEPSQLPIESPSLFMSVVVPAFNEEDRLGGMLEEAVSFLEEKYGGAEAKERKEHGWEIIIVSDGSTDATVERALEFARSHQLSQHPAPVKGPWTEATHGTHIPHGSIRVVALEENRGKGGAVTHGMRHVRGKYIVFADADGASRFEDLGKLVDACKSVEDKIGRGVAVGSRAHLVGSEAVVKRSKLRNFLMHSFHLLLRIMTPSKTARIRDTQCGFKLFSRAALPDIIPYMHSEGWIFDVEMLMLAESANIAMVEVAVGWKEVMGSKLNVVSASIGMAWGLAILRAAWILGVYKKE